MALIPDNVVQEILSRTDLCELIRQFVPLKRRGAHFFACCPFHQEKTASFCVSTDRQIYHCFGCGAHGSAIRFLMTMSGLTFRAAVQELAARAGVVWSADCSQRVDAPPTSARVVARDILTRVASCYAQQLHASAVAKVYLADRGLSEHTIACYQLGYAEGSNFAAFSGEQEERVLREMGLLLGDSGRRERFRRRIMFPIQDEQNHIVGFGGRVLDHTEPKYLNSPETALFVKRTCLYGLPQARTAIYHTGVVLVVEGYFDVILLAEHGVTNVVATLGTACTAKQLRLLFRYAPKVLFCFDGDEAGQRAAWRVLENSLPLLTDGRHVSFLTIPVGQDPDSYVREWGKDGFVALQKDHEQSLSAYFFEKLLARVDVSTIEGRAQLVSEAKPLMAQLPQGSVFRVGLMRRLSELAHVAVECVEEAQPYAQQKKVLPAKVCTRLVPSIEQKVMELLSTHPQHYAAVDRSWIDQGQPLASALLFLLEVLHQRRGAVLPSQLLEITADSDHRDAFLLVWSKSVASTLDEVEWQEEFSGAVWALEKQALARSCRILTQRAYHQVLSGSEREELLRALTRLNDCKQRMPRMRAVVNEENRMQ